MDRNVYTQSFGGVFWDTLDIALENIERIEVIRGPGATVWGENAVNGVVNILLKNASATHGLTGRRGRGNTCANWEWRSTAELSAERSITACIPSYVNYDELRGQSTESGADGWHLLEQVSARTRSCRRKIRLRCRETCIRAAREVPRRR